MTGYAHSFLINTKRVKTEREKIVKDLLEREDKGIGDLTRLNQVERAEIW